ncbi:hypothetical protein G7K_5035-t1 [Saitoella complicata NRRL Y-17804]|uniref:Uncharacterized protein n=1 Tax=Saitoella complicata (strain BCRC 22490 / CBS 7301 / JCM 7358 / NBRC 10748 / NRRL Y-17804) TaxID=698492 RepID=A0A0E9NMM1_SAICN|nr:hypothetical protein G7K_5035-t1 [Saitoella complicata NRRL Y-17804]
MHIYPEQTLSAFIPSAYRLYTSQSLELQLYTQANCQNRSIRLLDIDILSFPFKPAAHSALRNTSIHEFASISIYTR